MTLFNLFFFIFFSYIIEQDACFLTLCDRNFNKKLAYSFLEDLSQEFYNQYGHRINTATRPYSFIEFGKTKKKLRENEAQCGKHGNLLITLFWQKFRENNVFTEEATKELVSRNIFLVRENFSFFHTVLISLFVWQKFCEINCRKKWNVKISWKRLLV